MLSFTTTNKKIAKLDVKSSILAGMIATQFTSTDETLFDIDIQTDPDGVENVIADLLYNISKCSAPKTFLSANIDGKFVSEYLDVKFTELRDTITMADFNVPKCIITICRTAGDYKIKIYPNATLYPRVITVQPTRSDL